MADFAPVQSPGDLNQSPWLMSDWFHHWTKYVSSLIPAYSLRHKKTRRQCHPQNRKYITYCTAVKGGMSHM